MRTGTWIHEITSSNFLGICIAFAVRHGVEFCWLDEYDQFQWPKDSWQSDEEFQLDCLVFSLFHNKNRISCKTGVNHWIPFSEAEVDAKDAYKSHFMIDFLSGRGRPARDSITISAGEPPASRQEDLFAATKDGHHLAPNPSILQPFNFSTTASRVLDAGRQLWRYYHSQPNAMPDASFYDIRAHFQGFKPNGHMNPDSTDAEYTRLIGDLRVAMKSLAAKLALKVREHGFLR